MQVKKTSQLADKLSQQDREINGAFHRVVHNNSINLEQRLGITLSRLPSSFSCACYIYSTVERDGVVYTTNGNPVNYSGQVNFSANIILP